MKFASNHIPSDHTILLVDDEKQVRRFMHTLLVSEGYNVIIAADGFEAVFKYSECFDNITLVLMDISMPRKDGVAAYHEIKDMNPNAIILLMSAYSESSIGHIPNLHFIKKPMVSAELLKKISELIESYNQNLNINIEDDVCFRDVSYTESTA